MVLVECGWFQSKTVQHILPLLPFSIFLSSFPYLLFQSHVLLYWPVSREKHLATNAIPRTSITPCNARFHRNSTIVRKRKHKHTDIFFCLDLAQAISLAGVSAFSIAPAALSAASDCGGARTPPCREQHSPAPYRSPRGSQVQVRQKQGKVGSGSGNGNGIQHHRQYSQHQHQHQQHSPQRRRIVPPSSPTVTLSSPRRTTSTPSGYALLFAAMDPTSPKLQFGNAGNKTEVKGSPPINRPVWACCQKF